MALFPEQREDVIYLTEGGQETELMYKFGFELPEFAMYPLLDNAEALAAMRGMYQRVLETAAKHQVGVLLGGLDYRASPDWASKLGYSREGLADAQFRCIGFLREAAEPFEGQIPDIKIVGCVGPRGDAYSLNRTITAEEAEDYHAVQIETLKRAGVDLISAMTFNNIEEAVGVARAAAKANMPLTVSFTLDSTHRLKSGPSLKQAIEQTDARAGDARPAFYGVNCSHPVEFEPALEPGDWIKRVRSLRPNASAKEKVELCKIGHLEDGDPVEFGEQMGDLARRYPHIDVWGGCCGTWERHLDHIAANVKRVRGL
ncbi:MAG: homocysteine S-methyltransferase family protein [Hyphomonadaceae bacterium]|nr:homocysteine S-methyltransferase family protein [Hyphomonadaceae bacterium]